MLKGPVLLKVPMFLMKDLVLLDGLANGVRRFRSTRRSNRFAGLVVLEGLVVHAVPSLA